MDESIYTQAVRGPTPVGHPLQSATAVVVVEITPPPDPTGFSVVFDHPFVFFVRDVQTNALLFVGHVDMP